MAKPKVRRKPSKPDAFVTVRRVDWNALKVFFLDVEQVYIDSYGLPGKEKETWLDELRKGSPKDVEIYLAAAQAIHRTRA